MVFGTTTGAFVGGCVALFAACLIAAAGGVGGGGLIVPILLLIFEYDLDAAVALSNCVVAGSSVAQLMINVTKRHPNHPSRPLIYWELVLTLLPAQLGGANIGNILSHITPESAVYILALLVLLYASTITLRKGLHKWHDENEKFLKEAEARNTDYSSAIEHGEDIVNPINNTTGKHSFQIERSSNSNNSLMLESNQDHNEAGSKSKPRRVSGDEGLYETFRESLSIYTDPSKLQLPTMYIVTVVIMWICYSGLSIGRTELTPCSQTYLAFLGIIYVPLLIAHCVSYFLNKKVVLNSPAAAETTTSKDEEETSGTVVDTHNSSQVESMDIDLNKHALPLIASGYGVGIICAMLGLGGGEIFSPIILSYGVLPQVTSGTTATMSFFNSLNSSLRGITKHTFDVRVGAIVFMVGCFSGIIGRQLGLWISAKYGRASVIIFFLSFGLYLSCLYYIYELGFTSFDSAVHGFC